MVDKNGYAPSIVQHMAGECYITGRSDSKLDRHEIFHGPYRAKSKRLGLWVLLDHEIHMQLHQKDAELDKNLKKTGQLIAMGHYSWTTDEFIKQFGKNYL